MGQIVRQAPSSVGSDAVYGVTTSAANVLAANTNRTSAVLQNVSTSTVYVRFGAAPVVSGTKYYSAALAPASVADGGDGGSMTIDHFKGDIYVICASGSSILIATEFIR
jgi:hypothetical protein